MIIGYQLRCCFWGVLSLQCCQLFSRADRRHSHSWRKSLNTGPHLLLEVQPACIESLSVKGICYGIQGICLFLSTEKGWRIPIKLSTEVTVLVVLQQLVATFFHVIFLYCRQPNDTLRFWSGRQKPLLSPWSSKYASYSSLYTETCGTMGGILSW